MNKEPIDLFALLLSGLKKKTLYNVVMEAIHDFESPREADFIVGWEIVWLSPDEECPQLVPNETPGSYRRFRCLGKDLLVAAKEEAGDKPIWLRISEPECIAPIPGFPFPYRAKRMLTRR